MWTRGRFQVGATRLSIIDTTAGAQPVFNEQGDACVVFNGEIYNHRELRADLRARGHAFHTDTDTEVIIHLYEEYGAKCVQHLHGMFAFAICDGTSLFLARDRLGIKPLYYALLPGGGDFIFASEIKAILQNPGVAARLNRQALAHRVVLGHCVEPETFFDGIRSLPAGHTMRVHGREILSIDGPHPYFKRMFAREDAVPFPDAQRELEQRLDAAVRTHLAADVEVGLTLSGGLDSSILALLARRHATQRLTTFTVGDHPEHPDVLQAAQVARMIGSNHHTLIVGFDDYVNAIPAMIAAEEKPSSLFGMPFFLLCRTIAQRVKASLHGEGADELFGGYEDYLDPAPRRAQFRESLPLLKQLGIAPNERATATITRLSGWAEPDEYLQSVFELNLGDALEQFHLLPVDKFAMAASVEMRVPYLDDAVCAFAFGLPLPYLVRRDLGVGKYILRRLALDSFGPGLLDVVLRRKLGFPASGRRHLGRFDDLCNRTLPDSYVRDHEFGYCFATKRQLLMFDLFTEIFLEHRGDVAGVGSVTEFMRARSGSRRSARVALAKGSLQ